MLDTVSIYQGHLVSCAGDTDYDRYAASRTHVQLFIILQKYISLQKETVPYHRKHNKQ